jgi:hypothetical protein
MNPNGYRLGKLAARRDAVKLKFADSFLVADLPTPPVVFGRDFLIAAWGILANDKISDCTIAGPQHQVMLWEASAGNPIPQFSDQTAALDYSACCGYDPGDPATDQGGDLQAVAGYWRKTGMGDAAGKRHQVAAYAALRAGDIDQINTAAYLLGSVGLGLQLPSSAIDQFRRGEPWSIVKGSPIEGGHLVPQFGRNRDGNLIVVTWGRPQAVEPAFAAEYMDEGLAYLDSTWIDGSKTLRGFDAAGFAQKFTQLTQLSTGA